MFRNIVSNITVASRDSALKAGRAGKAMMSRQTLLDK